MPPPSCSIDELGEIDVLHVEAQIGLVVAVECASIRRTASAGNCPDGKSSVQIDAERVFPDGEDEPFDEAEDVVLVHERHLDVDLRELGLAIEAQILVAEAVHDLEVAVEARPP